MELFVKLVLKVFVSIAIGCGDKDDTRDQKTSSLEIVNNESSVGELSREIQETLTLSQRHKFWETQHVV
ncbi:hypothetical protein R6Q59_031196 [Mikania micrantha]